MNVTSEVFWPATTPGEAIKATSFYVRPTGVEKMAHRVVQTKSDLVDCVELWRSSDNGASWGPCGEFRTWEEHPAGGTIRRHVMPSFVDPGSGRLVTFYSEGHMPNDDPIADGMRNQYLKYRVSLDGGRTHVLEEMVIQDGYTPEQPMRGVTVGKNTVMFGDRGSETIRARGGRLLVPVQVCPVGPDGEYINPGGGYTYHEAAVLIGRWSDDADDPRVTWDLSPYIRNDPAKSTRGAVEPTITQFADGRVLMVLRGSNDVRPELPGRRWYTVSHDEGDSWEPVREWTYADGGPFFSPSSMSQLLAHSSGHCYWIGNITPENPLGNGPRYPIVIGRVDPASLLLERDTVRVIDDLRPGDNARLGLSCFHAHEDRETREIVMHMSRFTGGGPDTWTTDALVYRFAP